MTTACTQPCLLFSWSSLTLAFSAAGSSIVTFNQLIVLNTQADDCWEATRQALVILASEQIPTGCLHLPPLMKAAQSPKRMTKVCSVRNHGLSSSCSSVMLAFSAASLRIVAFN